MNAPNRSPDQSAASLVFKEILKLECHERALTVLFDLFRVSAATEFDKRVYAERLHHAMPSELGENWSIPKIASELVDAESAANAESTFQGVAAGTIFLVASSFVQTLGSRLGLNQNHWLETGVEINGVRLGRIVWASANNFRHYEEWSSVNTRNSPSISVLQNLGFTEPWTENKCAAILNLIIDSLNPESYDDFAKYVRLIGFEQFWLAFPTSEALGRRR